METNTKRPENRNLPGRHTLTLDCRNHAVITGVMDVCSFDETEITLKIEKGLLFLTGEGLHIGKLLLEDGRLDVDGQLDSIIYEKPKGPAKRWILWGQRGK